MYRDLFKKIYPIAVSCGVDASGFWNMSLKQIEVAVKGFQERRRVELQEQAVIAWRMADHIAYNIGAMFNNKTQPLAVHEAFPGFFPELERPKQPVQQDWRIAKARMEAFAIERKKRGEKKNGNDARGNSGSNNGADSAVEKAT